MYLGSVAATTYLPLLPDYIAKQKLSIYNQIKPNAPQTGKNNSLISSDNIFDKLHFFHCTRLSNFAEPSL